MMLFKALKLIFAIFRALKYQLWTLELQKYMSGCVGAFAKKSICFLAPLPLTRDAVATFATAIYRNLPPCACR